MNLRCIAINKRFLCALFVLALGLDGCQLLIGDIDLPDELDASAEGKDSSVKETDASQPETDGALEETDASQPETDASAEETEP